MQYMFLIYSPERQKSPEEFEQLRRRHSAVLEEAKHRGVLLAVDRLKSSDTATTVRTREGAQITLDGPFAETKEQLAGYYILECADLDEAIDWARRIPPGYPSTAGASDGCIEIRPIAEMTLRP